MTRASLLLAVLVALLATGPLGAQDSTVTRRRSWTTDRMQIAVGDIITVLIDERTLASTALRDDDAARRGRAMEAGASLPGGTAPGGSVRSSQNADAQRSGEAVRQNSFRAEISARVIAVSPTGMLQIRGEKRVQLDRHVQIVTVTGWMRADDVISLTNSIESFRLADAQITYAQEGGLGRPRGGILTRLVGAIWP